MSEPQATGAPGETPRIVATESVLGGDPRIEGTRVGVHTVYERYTREDTTVAEIATDYDLSRSEVHAALTYAYANLEEMRAIERRTAEILRRELE